MRKIIAEKISAFLKDEEGLTMVEYAVAGALVAAGAAAAFTSLGTSITASIQYLEDCMTVGGACG